MTYNVFGGTLYFAQVINQQKKYNNDILDNHRANCLIIFIW